MRLVYQKYKNTERKHADDGVLSIENDVRLDHSKVSNIRIKIETELGFSATISFLLLFAVIFNAMDIVVFYSFLYYVPSCIAVILIYSKKAIVASKKYEIK